MKNTFLKTLLVSTILIAMTFAFSAKTFTRGESFADKSLVQEKLKEDLATWILENYSAYYENIVILLTPKYIAIENTIATAVFDARIDLTLKAEKVEDLPFMRGMLNYYNSKRATATEAQIEAANKLINDWKLELEDYIGKPEPSAYATYKIIAFISGDNVIEKRSIKLYIVEPSLKGSGEDFYPIDSPVFQPPEEMEKSGSDQMKKVFEEIIQSSDKETLSTQDKSTLLYTYDRLAARDYANSWTSNAPDNGDCFMDSSKWNNDVYPYYDNAYCNDCADYVSQAIHAGGIPIDSGQWDRLNDGDGTYV